MSNNKDVFTIKFEANLQELKNQLKKGKISAKEFATQSKKIMTKEFAEATNKIKKNAKEIDNSFNKLKKSSSKPQIGKLSKNIKGNFSEIKTQLSGLTSNFGRFGGVAGNALSGIPKGAALAGAALAGFAYAVADSVSEAVAKFAEFEQQLSSIATLANDPAMELPVLKSSIDELSQKYGKAVGEIGGSMENILGSGMLGDDATAAQIEMIVDQTTKASIAADAAADDVANAAIKMAGGFSLNIKEMGTYQEILDTILKTDQVGAFKNRVSELAKYMPEASTAARMAGLSLQEYSAQFAALSTVLPGSSQIATGLKQFYSQLANPQVAERLKAINVEIRDQNGKIKNNIEILSELNDALNKQDILTDGRKLGQDEVIGEIFGSVDAVAAIQGLMGNLDGLQQKLNATKESAGTVDQAFSFMSNTMATASQVRTQEEEAAYRRVGESWKGIVSFVKEAIHEIKMLWLNFIDNIGATVGTLAGGVIGLFFFGPLGAAVGAAIGAALGALTDAVFDFRSEAEKLKDSLESVAKGVNELEKAKNIENTVKKLSKEYNELANQLKNIEKGSKEYNDIQSKLNQKYTELNRVAPAFADQLRSLRNDTDALASATNRYTEQLENLTNIQKQALEVQVQSAISTAKESMVGASEDYLEAYSEWKNAIESGDIDDIKDATDDYNEQKQVLSDMQNDLRAITDFVKQDEELMQKYGESLHGMFDSIAVGVAMVVGVNDDLENTREQSQALTEEFFRLGDSIQLAVADQAKISSVRELQDELIYLQNNLANNNITVEDAIGVLNVLRSQFVDSGAPELADQVSILQSQINGMDAGNAVSELAKFANSIGNAISQGLNFSGILNSLSGIFGKTEVSAKKMQVSLNPPKNPYKGASGGIRKTNRALENSEKVLDRAKSKFAQTKSEVEQLREQFRQLRAEAKGNDQALANLAEAEALELQAIKEKERKKQQEERKKEEEKFRQEQERAIEEEYKKQQEQEERLKEERKQGYDSYIEYLKAGIKNTITEEINALSELKRNILNNAAITEREKQRIILDATKRTEERIRFIKKQQEEKHQRDIESIRKAGLGEQVDTYTGTLGNFAQQLISANQQLQDVLSQSTQDINAVRAEMAKIVQENVAPYIRLQRQVEQEAIGMANYFKNILKYQQPQGEDRLSGLDVIKKALESGLKTESGDVVLATSERSYEKWAELLIEKLQNMDIDVGTEELNGIILRLKRVLSGELTGTWNIKVEDQFDRALRLVTKELGVEQYIDELDQYGDRMGNNTQAMEKFIEKVEAGEIFDWVMSSAVAINTSTPQTTNSSYDESAAGNVQTNMRGVSDETNETFSQNRLNVRSMSGMTDNHTRPVSATDDILRLATGWTGHGERFNEFLTLTRNMYSAYNQLSEKQKELIRTGKIGWEKLAVEMDNSVARTKVASLEYQKYVSKLFAEARGFEFDVLKNNLSEGERAQREQTKQLNESLEARLNEWYKYEADLAAINFEESFTISDVRGEEFEDRLQTKMQELISSYSEGEMTEREFDEESMRLMTQYRDNAEVGIEIDGEQRKLSLEAAQQIKKLYYEQLVEYRKLLDAKRQGYYYDEQSGKWLEFGRAQAEELARYQSGEKRINIGGLGLSDNETGEQLTGSIAMKIPNEEARGQIRTIEDSMTRLKESINTALTPPVFNASQWAQYSNFVMGIENDIYNLDMEIYDRRENLRRDYADQLMSGYEDLIDQDESLYGNWEKNQENKEYLAAYYTNKQMQRYKSYLDLGEDERSQQRESAQLELDKLNNKEELTEEEKERKKHLESELSIIDQVNEAEDDHSKKVKEVAKDQLEVARAIGGVADGLNTVNQGLQAVNGVIQKSREGTLEWSDVTNAIGDTLMAMPDPVLKAVGAVVKATTALIQVMDDIIITAEEAAEIRAAKRAKKYMEMLKEQAKELETMLESREDYAEIENKINEILQTRLDIYKEIQKYNELNTKNLNTQQDVVKNQINTALQKLDELGFSLGVGDVDSERFGEWLKQYEKGLAGIADGIGDIDLDRLKELENIVEGSVNNIENANYQGYVQPILDAIDAGTLRGDQVLEAWAERRGMLVNQYRNQLRAGEIDQGEYYKQIGILNWIEDYMHRIADAQNEAFDIEKLVEANEILGDLTGNVEEYRNILESIITTELNRLEIHKELGLIDESSNEYIQKKLELLNKALKTYLKSYNIQYDVNNLTNEQILNLLKETQYNETVRNLLKQKLDLQKEMNSELAEELGYLNSINNAEVQSLIAKYNKVKTMEKLGAITSEEATFRKSLILGQIRDLLSSLGYDSSLIQKTVELLAETIMNVGGGNVGQGGAVQSFHKGGTVPKEDLYLLDKGEEVLTPENAKIWRNLVSVLQKTSFIGKPNITVPKMLTGLSGNVSNSSITNNYSFGNISVNANDPSNMIDQFEKLAKHKRVGRTIKSKSL